MITRETACLIVYALDEIAHGKKLADDMREALKRGEAWNIRDTFGRPRGLQLGVPCSDKGTTLFDVSPRLAAAMIDAHVACKLSELVALNEKAKLEIETCAVKAAE